MHILPSFQCLKNEEINKDFWDECVLHSTNQLIYARAFYLDFIAAGWSALVGENYDWVLPVTSRKKYGISYLSQPAFTQQLGIFAKPGVQIPYPQIIKVLQNKYKFWEINWNYQSIIENLVNSTKLTTRNNYVLNLSADYKTIAVKYHQDLAKNLKKSSKHVLIYQATEDFKKAIELYIKLYRDRTPHVTTEDYHNFSHICNYTASKNMLLCREVINENEEMVAVALLLFDGKRIYNVMNSTTESGRKMAANHFLIDALLREFAGTELILDFEGSDLPGVKSFYENFGAGNEPYFSLKYNNLPWPLKLLK